MNHCPNCASTADPGTGCRVCGFAPAVVAGFEAYATELAMAGPGYDPAHYAKLAALESGNFWFKSRNELILWAIRKFFRARESYLEVGCGTGFVLAAIADEFPDMDIHGSEVFVEGLRFAKDRVPRAHLFQMDATRIPYRSGFDVIGAFDVLEHIENDVGVLEEMHRSVRPGGGIILTVPQHAWLWSSQDEVAHHVRRYTRAELVRKVTAAGFRIGWTSSFVSLLLPAMIVSRWRKPAGTGGESDAYSEFEIPRSVDALLLLAMRIERALLRAGIRLPIGGSRILVAYKDPA